MRLNNCTDSTKNATVFFYNGIGDAIFCLPTLRALSQIFKNEVTLICPKEMDAWYFDEIKVKRVIKIHAELKDGVFEFDSNELHQKVPACDIFFSLVSWLSVSLIHFIKLLSPKTSVGYFKEYDIFISSLHVKNSFEANFDSVKLLYPSYNLINFSHQPKYTPDSLSAAELFISQMIDENKKIISIHMETKENKMWDLNKLSNFLKMFLEKQNNYTVLLVSSLPMRVNLEGIEDRVIPIFGFNLSFACALISLSNIFLGVDSCMLHLADLCRIPGVGLFGPTDSKRFGFYFSKHIHLDKHKEVSVISVEEVMDAISFFA